LAGLTKEVAVRSDLMKIGVVTIAVMTIGFIALRITYVKTRRTRTTEARSQAKIRIGMSSADVSKYQKPDVLCLGGRAFESAAYDFDPSISKSEIRELDRRTAKRFLYFNCVVRVAEMDRIRRTCQADQGAAVVGFDRADRVLWFNSNVGSTYIVTSANSSAVCSERRLVACQEASRLVSTNAYAIGSMPSGLDSDAVSDGFIIVALEE
jgi:hypothetical protein